MTEVDRKNKLVKKLWYWFPLRWTYGGTTWRIHQYKVTGDEEEGGIDVTVVQGTEAPQVIHFTNDECYGASALSVSSARGRVTSL